MTDPRRLVTAPADGLEQLLRGVRSVEAAALELGPSERAKVCAALAGAQALLLLTPATPPEVQDEDLTTDQAWRLVGEPSRDVFLRRESWRRALLGTRRRPLKWRKRALLEIKAEQIRRFEMDAGVILR